MPSFVAVLLRRLVNRSRSPAALANAVSAPASLLAAGAVAAGTILAGAGLPVGLAAGAGAWAVSTLVKIRGVRSARAVARAERIDAFALREPWRRYVQSMLSTQQRFERAVLATRPGPLRDRLTEIGRRVHDAVHESWELAKQGDRLDRAVEGYNVTEIRRELAVIRAEMARSDPSRHGALGKAAESVAARLGSVERMAERAQQLRDRAVVLDAQLDEIIAKATELSVTASSVDELTPLGTEVDHLVDEMESLRRAFADTETAPASRSVPAPGAAAS
jgi:hypothetical protein